MGGPVEEDVVCPAGDADIRYDAGELGVDTFTAFRWNRDHLGPGTGRMLC